MWPFRRRRGGSQQETGSSPITRGASPAGETGRGWVSVPPIGASLPPMQRTIAIDAFEKGLAARRPPQPFLAPLGHLVSSLAPSGVVGGMAVVARSTATSGDEAELPPSLRVAPVVPPAQPAHPAGHPSPRRFLSPMVTASSMKTPTVVLRTVPPISSPSPDLTHWLAEPARSQDLADGQHRVQPGNPVAKGSLPPPVPLMTATPAGPVATAPAQPDSAGPAEKAAPGLPLSPVAPAVGPPTLQRMEASPSVTGGGPHVETPVASGPTMAALSGAATPVARTEKGPSVSIDQAAAAHGSVQSRYPSSSSRPEAAGMALTPQHVPVQRTSTSAVSAAGPSPALPLARALQDSRVQRSAGETARRETPVVAARPSIVMPASPVEQPTEPTAKAASRPPRGLGAPVQRPATGGIAPTRDGFPVVAPGAATTRPVVRGVTTTEAPTAASSPPVPSMPAQTAPAGPPEDAPAALTLGAEGHQPGVQRRTPSAAFPGQPVGPEPLTTVMTVPPVETPGTPEIETAVNPATGRVQRAAEAGALSSEPSLPSLPLVGSRHESHIQRTVDSPESPVIAKSPLNPTASPQTPSGPRAEAALSASPGPAAVQRAAPAAERTVDVPEAPIVAVPRSTVITGTRKAVKAVADQVLPVRRTAGPGNALDDSSLPLVSAMQEPHVQRTADTPDAPVIAARPLTATGSPAAHLATSEDAAPPLKPGLPSTVRRTATQSAEASNRGVGPVLFAAGTQKASAQGTLGSPGAPVVVPGLSTDLAGTEASTRSGAGQAPLGRPAPTQGTTLGESGLSSLPLMPAKDEAPVQRTVESLDAPIMAGRPLTPSAAPAARHGTPAELNQKGVLTVAPGSAPQQPAVQRTTGSLQPRVTVAPLPTALARTETPLVRTAGSAPLAHPTAEPGNTIADPRISSLPLVPAGHEAPLQRTVDSQEAPVIALRPLTATTTAPVKSPATTAGLRTGPPESKSGATSSPQPPPTGQLLLTRSAQPAGTVNPSTPPSAGPQQAATGVIGTGRSVSAQRSTSAPVSPSGSGILPALAVGLGAPVTVPAADRPVQRRATRAGRSETWTPALPFAQARVSPVVPPTAKPPPVTARPATTRPPQVQRTPATAPAAVAAQPPPPAPPALDLDDLAARIYDRVLFRLRRDLRRELERKGLSAGLRK